jgi:hypothetical protein
MGTSPSDFDLPFSDSLLRMLPPSASGCCRLLELVDRTSGRSCPVLAAAAAAVSTSLVFGDCSAPTAPSWCLGWWKGSLNCTVLRRGPGPEPTVPFCLASRESLGLRGVKLGLSGVSDSDRMRSCKSTFVAVLCSPPGRVTLLSWALRRFGPCRIAGSLRRSPCHFLVNHCFTGVSRS